MDLVMSLRNVGAGIAVLDGWHLDPDFTTARSHADLSSFRRLTRDIYVPPSDTGWITSVSRHWNVDRADPR